MTETELLRLAYALERRSEHPLAKAVLRRAEADGLTAAEVADFQALPGNGLRAALDGKPLCGGNADFIRTAADISAPMQAQAQALAEAGKTPLFLPAAGSCSASSPWRTCSSPTARRPSVSCGIWASASS